MIFDANDLKNSKTVYNREASEAVGTVLDRWTLADLAREESDAQERKARNVIYHI